MKNINFKSKHSFLSHTEKKQQPNPDQTTMQTNELDNPSKALLPNLPEETINPNSSEQPASSESIPFYRRMQTASSSPQEPQKAGLKMQLPDVKEKLTALKSLQNRKWFFPASSACACLAAILCITQLASCASLSSQSSQILKLQSEAQEMKLKNEKVQQKVLDLESEKTVLLRQTNEQKAEIEELKNGKDKMLVDIRNAFDQKNWTLTIQNADALHEKYNGSDQDAEGQKLKKQAEAKLAEEEKKRKEKEAAEEKKRQEEKAKGYETGITYEQLARTPDDFIGDKVKFTGKVLQVSKGESTNLIRLAVNGNYNQVILGSYDQGLTSTRVLEDDTITIYGMSLGEYTYEAVLGNSITLPLVAIEKIDQ